MSDARLILNADGFDAIYVIHQISDRHKCLRKFANVHIVFVKKHETYENYYFFRLLIFFIEPLANFCVYWYAAWYDTPRHELHTPGGGSEPGVTGPIFWYVIAEVFLHNINSGVEIL